MGALPAASVTQPPGPSGGPQGLRAQLVLKVENAGAATLQEHRPQSGARAWQQRARTRAPRWEGAAPGRGVGRARGWRLSLPFLPRHQAASTLFPKGNGWKPSVSVLRASAPGSFPSSARSGLSPCTQALHTHPQAFTRSHMHRRALIHTHFLAALFSAPTVFAPEARGLDSPPRGTRPHPARTVSGRS